jgi:hypothetical protein
MAATAAGLSVHLASTGIPRERSCIPAFEELARASASTHELTDDPASADLILFTECHLHDDWRLRAISEHPLRRRFPRKCYVYNERDNPWCILPGVYVSYPHRSFRREWIQPWGYYALEDVRQRQGWVDRSPDLLCSMTATPTHSSRECLYHLVDEECVFERTDGFVFYDPMSEEWSRRRERHLELLSRSSFVLCPRGAGASSIRLFEVMAAGRVPVIVSDAWVAPEGPDWEEFALRWPENEPDGLLDFLRSHRASSESMGLRARAAFETWFSPDVSFGRLMDLYASLIMRNAAEGFPRFGVRDVRYLSVATSAARVRAGALRRRLTT